MFPGMLYLEDGVCMYCTQATGVLKGHTERKQNLRTDKTAQPVKE